MSTKAQVENARNLKLKLKEILGEILDAVSIENGKAAADRHKDFKD